VVHGLGFSADGSHLIALASGSMGVWNPRTGQRTDQTCPAANDVPSPSDARADQPAWYRYLQRARGGSTYAGDEIDAATSHDHTLLAWESEKEGVVIECVATREQLSRLEFRPCDAHALAFSPDNTLIATGCEDHSVRVWDVATGAERAVMRGHTGRVYTVDFSPDGTRIVSGGNDNIIILWDSKSFEQVAELQGHASYVHSVAFSPEGSRIVSGSGDFTVRIWDTILPRQGRASLDRGATGAPGLVTGK
jgi:WD40 repeat protein